MKRLRTRHVSDCQLLKGSSHYCSCPPDKQPLSRLEVEVLAAYNAESSRGIVHTEEWKAAMARLQDRYDYHLYNCDT